MSRTSPLPLPGEALPDGALTDLGLHPLVDRLAGTIRRARCRLPELDVLPLAPELEAISGQLDGEDLFIHNEVHRSRGLRKLHLETARLGAGLQILHCVFFPDPRFDLPVFGADIVAARGVVSAAIADLSPVTAALPQGIRRELEGRPLPPFSQRRELPPWGAIFSPHVVFVRPASAQEEEWFIDQVEGFLRVLTDALSTATPQPPDAPATLRRWEGQLHYCKRQKQNDKTRRVLEKAFNPQWANQYIEQLLFDDPPAPSPSA
jgi:phycocyanobilin:ferredoxin oxidoreductase